MNVEDSYEGALRRLQRLEMAGVVAMQQAPAAAIEQAARDSSVERMRELEELATLACEENERLEGELDGARQEVEGARRELEGARRELEQLRGQVASLRQAAANAPQPMFASAAEQAFASTPEQAFAPAPEQAFAPAASPFAPAASPFAPAASPFAPSPFANDASFDDELDYPPKSGRGALYFFLVALAGAGLVTLFVTRPWERPRSAPIVVEPAAPAPPPVVTAPPAPKAEPAVPKLAPTVPKLAPTIPKAPALAAHGPRATKARPARKHAKHHAAKKHGAAKSRDAAPANDDDPLGGTGL